MKRFAQRRAGRALAIPAQFENRSFNAGETQGGRKPGFRRAGVDEDIGIGRGVLRFNRLRAAAFGGIKRNCQKPIALDHTFGEKRETPIARHSLKPAPFWRFVTT